MFFILASLATYYVWQFLYLNFTTSRVPDYVWHLVVPLVFLGVWFLPFLAITCLAGAAAVGWLHQLRYPLYRSGSTVPMSRTPKRSKVPPIG